MPYGSLRDRLMGTDIRTPGAISQFEGFRNREDQMNPFANLGQATAPMANAGATGLGTSQNGAPTTTAVPAPPAMSTGAPLGTMAHTGGGGPFTFGFPFGVDEREEGGGTDAAGGESEAGPEGGPEGGGEGEGGEGGDDGDDGES